jgi:predicted DsbA family dithiol-disulfide isomerase
MDIPAPPLQATALTIDVVSDVVCPWCYLGKRRLERAQAIVADVNVAIRWRPFQLDPTVPPGGIDRQDYLRRKFGDPRRIEAAHERLAAFGKAEGIDYRFDLIRRSPNTIDAHRVVRWAAGEREGAMVERLFRAYFTEGFDIGDHAVLAALAGEAGLDPSAVAARLATDDDRETVTAEIERAYRLGVTGVPTFIVASHYGVVGAEAPGTIAEAIRQAAAEAVPGGETASLF